jgi:hypothetical protein
LPERRTKNLETNADQSCDRCGRCARGDHVRQVRDSGTACARNILQVLGKKLIGVLGLILRLAVMNQPRLFRRVTTPAGGGCRIVGE